MLCRPIRIKKIKTSNYYRDQKYLLNPNNYIRLRKYLKNRPFSNK